MVSVSIIINEGVSIDIDTPSLIDVIYLKNMMEKFVALGIV